MEIFLTECFIFVENLNLYIELLEMLLEMCLGATPFHVVHLEEKKFESI